MGFHKAASAGEISASRWELGRRFIISGRTGPCATRPLYNMCLPAVLTSERVRYALVRVNRDQLLVMEALATASVQRLGKGEAGFCQSGQHLLDAPLESWFLSCAELAVVNGCDEDLGLFVDPEHNDGGTYVSARRVDPRRSAGVAGEARRGSARRDASVRAWQLLPRQFYWPNAPSTSRPDTRVGARAAVAALGRVRRHGRVPHRVAPAQPRAYERHDARLELPEVRERM